MRSRCRQPWPKEAPGLIEPRDVQRFRGLPHRRQVSGELGLALIGADSEVLSQSPEQIAEVSAEPLEYLLLRSPDLGPRFYATASWDSKTGWNNLSGGLVVSVTTGPSGSTISPHPARDIIPPLSGARASSYWIRCYIVFMLLLISAIAARTALPENLNNNQN